MTDWTDKLNEIPEAILPSVTMAEANQPISIHEGRFVLRGKIEIVVEGIIQFNWFPSLGSVFSGETTVDEFSMIVALQESNKFKLFINDIEFGDCALSSFAAARPDKLAHLEGVLIYEAVEGDKTIPVDKIRFGIPNLREFKGESVKYTHDQETSLRKSRLYFENDNYIITINELDNYSSLKESLKKNGGYIILYSGELIKKGKNITYNNTEDIFLCFSTFLSFLNGKRAFPLFRKGLVNEEVFWTDYKPYHVDTYKSLTSWPSNYSCNDLNGLWQNFSSIWKNNDNEEFLYLAIHWYLESNATSAFHNGAIILAQTGLELIYNWYLIEKKKILSGDDAKNITASNKIRLLISHLNISNEVPKAFTELQDYVRDKNIIDAPEAFVQIRNTIVHSQADRRRMLSGMAYEVKKQALELAIWYIELSLLYILNYKGQYYNRCSDKVSQYEKEELVPWV